MKKILLLLGVLALVLTPLFTLAQTDLTNGAPGLTPPPAAAPSAQTVLTMVIPLLVPVLIMLLKMGVSVGVPALPTWLLPILATALGALIDYVGSLTIGYSASPLAAALLGAAGIGLREVADQLRQAIAKPQPQS